MKLKNGSVRYLRIKSAIMKHTIIYFICVLFFSCAQQTSDTEKLKQEIISADKAMSDLAVKEGFNKALFEYAGEDFVKMNEGHYPVVGKADFEKQIEGKAGTKFISWEPLKAEVAQSGELGYTWGNWKYTTHDTIIYGNYFTIWKKQADGKWKMSLDGGNSTPAPRN